MRGIKSIKRSHFLIVSFLLLDLISSAGCDNKQKKEWEKTQKENTISSYEEFLKQYPRSKFDEEAHSRIEAIKERHPSFRDAKRARIFIQETYGEAKYTSMVYQINKTTSGLLKYADIKVITGQEEHDFAIQVNITGEALSNSYLNRGRLYTGAEVQGIITFNSKDGHEISKKFANREIPSTNIFITSEDEYRTPDDAPFAHVLLEPFSKKLARLMFISLGHRPLVLALNDADYKDICKDALDELEPDWRISDASRYAVNRFITDLKDEDLEVRRNASCALGIIKDPRAVEPLISVLIDKEWNVHDNAAWALGEIQDPRAVEPLISALKDRGTDVPWIASKALGKITGKDFGKDTGEWQRWWENNKVKYLK